MWSGYQKGICIPVKLHRQRHTLIKDTFSKKIHSVKKKHAYAHILHKALQSSVSSNRRLNKSNLTDIYFPSSLFAYLVLK